MFVEIVTSLLKGAPEALRKNKAAEPPPGFFAIPGGKKGGYKNNAGDYWYPPEGATGPVDQKPEAKKEARKTESASVLAAKDKVNEAAEAIGGEKGEALKAELEAALQMEGGERTYAVSKAKAKAAAVLREKAKAKREKERGEAKAARQKEREEAKAARDKERAKEKADAQEAKEKERKKADREKVTAKKEADRKDARSVEDNRERVKDAIADAEGPVKADLERRLEKLEAAGATPAKMRALVQYADRRVMAQRQEQAKEQEGQEKAPEGKRGYDANELGGAFNQLMDTAIENLQQEGKSLSHAVSAVNSRIKDAEKVVDRFDPKRAEDGRAVAFGASREKLREQKAALEHVYGKSHRFTLSGSGSRRKILAYRIGSKEARKEIEG